MATLMWQIKPWQLFLLLAGWMAFQLTTGIATLPLGFVKLKENPGGYWFLVGAEILVGFVSVVLYYFPV